MYKLIETLGGKSVIRTNEDGSATSIPFDPANTDYQTYLKWLEEGNQPLQPDEENSNAA